MKPTTSLVLVLMCVFLTACGGGTPRLLELPDGGATVFGPAATTPSFPRLGTGILDALTGDAPHADERGVVQSYGTVAPVNDVDTTFTGNRFSLALGREDGTRTVLDTHDLRTLTTTKSVFTADANPIRERPAVTGYAYQKEADGSLIVAYAFVEWNNADVTDYLAAGYWLQAHPVEQGVQSGAFLDGPVFADNPALQMPVTGTATYTGRAGGVSMGVIGPDRPQAGTAFQGEFEMRAVLTADFDRAEISGTLDQLSGKNTVYYFPNGGEQWISYTPPQEGGTSITLGAAPFSAGGTFIGSEVTINHPAFTENNRGAWGGKFSGVPDSAGNPVAVGGTFAVTGDSGGGTQASYSGMFYGVTDPSAGNDAGESVPLDPSRP